MPGSPLPVTPPNTLRVVLALMLLAVSLGSLRFIHVGADTPRWIAPFTHGEYVDEGYKTLSARNLAMYGVAHWHPQDHYRGWMNTSPIPSWAYYAAFKLGKPDVATARTTVVAIFGLLLCMFAGVGARSLPWPIVVFGLAILGLDASLFFFSRIALLEVPLAAILYSGLLMLQLPSLREHWRALGLIVLLAALITFGVKGSGLAYIAPAITSIALAVPFVGRPVARRYITITAGVLVLGGVVLLWLTSRFWMPRLELSPSTYLRTVASTPLLQLTPFLFLAGLLAAIHLLATDPVRIVKSAYLSAVTSIAVAGPLVIGLFPIDPPRYYIPLVPAYVLVLCEWLRCKAWRADIGAAGWLRATVSAAMLASWFVIAFLAMRRLSLPWAGGESLVWGRSVPALQGTWLLVIPLAILALAGLIRRGLFRGGIVAGFMIAAGFGFAFQNTARIASFLARPSFAAENLRRQIVAALPYEASIAGDWAPFFALGSNLKPLYLTDTTNGVGSIELLRPQFFLLSDTPGSVAIMSHLARQPSIHVGAPLVEGVYNGSRVAVIPVQYAPRAGEVTSP